MPPVAGGTQIGFRVGDAAPLVGPGRTCCLHELIALPGHILLLLLGDADPAGVGDGLALARAAAQQYRPHMQAYVVTRHALSRDDTARELLCDPTGALHARLGAAQPCLCLVRPDGHLGFRCEPPSLEALQAHLRID
jgi:hypothetical protein